MSRGEVGFAMAQVSPNAPYNDPLERCAAAGVAAGAAAACAVGTYIAGPRAIT